MKLRLLKVICQPVFVTDDGENLLEQPAEPVEISAAEWPHYATGRFAQSFEALRRQVEGDEAVVPLREVETEADTAASAAG